MYLADYHVHSRISPDASASMQEMAEAAIRLGFQEICFTDHVEPIRFGTTEPRGAYDWDPMIAEFRAARTAVGDRITLRLGAELGDAVWGIRRMESMLAEAPPLDFLIGSIHTLSEKMEGRDLYFLTPRDEQEARDCLPAIIMMPHRLPPPLTENMLSCQVSHPIPTNMQSLI